MRIVLATPIYPPEIGGPATYTVELAKRLQSSHSITTIAYSDTGEVVEGTELVRVKKSRSLPLRLTAFFFALFRVAKGVDVIYAQNAVAAGLPAVLVGKLRRIPVVIKFVGDEAWERATLSNKTKKRLADFYAKPEGGFRTNIFIGIQKFTLRRAAAVTTPSAYLAKLLTRQYDLDSVRITVNYNAVDELQRDESLAERLPYHVSVASRLVPWKHIDGVIRTVIQLKEKFPNIQLTIAGDGPERASLEQLVKELHGEAVVAFVGRVSQTEARRLQGSAAVHVLNSSYEGLPYEILNAFAMKTPVVATNIPGTDETVYNEKTGLLVAVGDTDELAKAIGRVFEDGTLREKVVEGGTKLLQEKFSWNSHIDTLLGIFSSLKK